MTSSDYRQKWQQLQREKSNFQSQLNKVISNYSDIASKINSINTSFQNSNDTILLGIANGSNANIIKACSNFVSRATSLGNSICSKIDDKISYYKQKEKDAAKAEAEEE